MKRIVSWIMLTLLLAGSFGLVCDVKLAAAGAETVYINSDGSVTPSGAPVSSPDNVTYTLTGNVSLPTYYGIVVKRSNIVLDGAGYAVQGNGPVAGINVTSINNVTVKNVNVNSFWYGIYFSYSAHNTVSKNNLTSNGFGVVLEYSDNNTVSGNKASESSYTGVWLWECSSNTVGGNNASANTQHGIYLYSSSNNTISLNNASANQVNGIKLATSSNNNKIADNNVTSNSDTGIYFVSSINNTVTGNTVANNNIGLELQSASGNTMYHNNFVGNTAHTSIDAASLHNAWNDSYPSGGNYWSDYAGVDSNHDGIGDTVHVMDGNNTDRYPLTGMFSDFNATLEHHIQTICNSTVYDFEFNGTAISFSVSAENGTTGFCRICIPTALMNSTYAVFVNGTEVQYDLLLFSNSTHNYLYFTYSHSTQEVIVVPEFPSATILTVFMALTLLATALIRKKRTRRLG